MRSHCSNRFFNSKLLLIAVLAVAILSACGQSSTPSESNSPTEISSSTESSSSASETSGSNQDSLSSAGEQQEISADSQLPDDGKLRVADSPDENGGTTVFCGSKIVYDGGGTATAFDGTEYFYVRRIVEDEYRSTVYNRDGEQLLEVPGGYPQLAGKWLICGGDMYGTSETTVVYDIETLEQVTLGGDGQQSQFCFEVNGYLCTTAYDYGATDTTIYNGEDLAVIAQFPGCSASSASELDGFVNLMRYDEASGESQTIYYRPSDDRQYNNVQYVCGQDLITVKTDGDYQVYDVTTDEVIAEGKNYSYYSDTVKIWRDSEGNMWVDAPCYEGEKQVSMAWSGWNTGDSYVNITCLDGSLEVLSLSGELVNRRDKDGEKALLYANDGMIIENAGDGSTPGLTLYFPDGQEKRYEQYNWLNGVLPGELMVGSYQFGNKYLYDLLDIEGNVLLQGLSSYSYPKDDGPFYVNKGFSYGFMDIEGNWLWKRSIFSSAVDEAGTVYW